jgi:putative transposase
VWQNSSTDPLSEEAQTVGNPRQRPDQIIAKLRQAEVELGRGLKVPEVCRKLGVTEQTYYRWRKEYGGLRTDQAKRLKELERENARLKKLVAEAELDKAILREAAAGNC